MHANRHGKADGTVDRNTLSKCLSSEELGEYLHNAIVSRLRRFLNSPEEELREKKARGLFRLVLPLVQGERDITLDLSGPLRDAVEFVLCEFSDYEVYYGRESDSPGFRTLKRDKKTLLAETRLLLSRLERAN